ncbi:MAG: NAD(P)H-dependent oxidoreductase subunit E, partial [Dictyoglomus sp.]
MLRTINEAMEYIEEKKNERKKKLQDLNIYVCVGTGCAAKGSIKVYEALKEILKENNIKVNLQALEESENRVKRTGCCGRCSSGPWVIVMPYGYFYSEVKPEDVREIYKETILKGKPVEKLLFTDPATSEKVLNLEEAKFFQAQSFYIMEEIGKCECDSIDDYMGRGGYLSFLKVLQEENPEKVIQVIKDSGLRGRGGAGFPTGLKWEITKNSKGDKKFVVCNGDEGDPGAFMNRTLLERDPHAVLEGMLIGAYTIGAQKGYAYIRAEYPVAVDMFRKAIEDARKLGLLGENILGTSFSFDIEIKEGAGAFVCGEETALLASIEG